MKAAIYCRLSDEDRDKLDTNDDSGSIQNQKSMLIRYAADNGWTIHDIYSDDDYAGSDRNRPAFNRLLQDANARKFQIVLCKTQSRFTRELELVEKYIHGLFPQLGIRFISVVDNADTDNRGNKKARQINALVNEWFLEELSENIQSIKTHRRQEGFHIGPFAPYGYQKDPNLKGHLIIDPEAAAIVREVFVLFESGIGKQGIAKALNDRGIPNPTKYKQLHGMIRNKTRKNSGLWSYFTISDMLVNQVYIGNMVQGKSGIADCKTQKKSVYPKDQWIIVEGTHEPIIERELWNRTQVLITQKASASSVRTEGKFAWKVRCLYCGSRLRSVKNGNKRGFRCERHMLSQDACVGTSISLPKLERIVAAQLSLISEELLNTQVLEEGIECYPDLRERYMEISSNMDKYQRRVDAANKGMHSLYIDKVKGLLSESKYWESIEAFRIEISWYRMKIGQCYEQMIHIDETLNAQLDKKQIVSQYVRTRQLTKEMINTLVDYILVGKKDPISKETPIEIHWNF